MADCPELKKLHWRCVVIDEAHRLKNRNCKLLEGLKLMNLVSLSPCLMNKICSIFGITAAGISLFLYRYMYSYIYYICCEMVRWKVNSYIVLHKFCKPLLVNVLIRHQILSDFSYLRFFLCMFFNRNTRFCWRERLFKTLWRSCLVCWTSWNRSSSPQKAPFWKSLETSRQMNRYVNRSVFV